MFKRVMGSHQPRNSAGNIVVTSATRPLLVWITLKLTNESTAARNPTNVPAATKASHRNPLSIAISRNTTNASPSTRTLVVRVAKRFTTARPSTLIFAPRIQLHNPLQLVNAPPLRKTQTHQLPKNLGGRTKQVSLQTQSPRQLLPLVQAGKRIPFSSLQTLFLVVKKTLLRCTDSTGHKFAADLAATTEFKTGTIFACRR